MEHAYTILLLAGSSMLIFSLSIKKFIAGLKALNHFWVKDVKAKELPYLKFLTSFFVSSLFDDNEDEQRLLAIAKLKSALHLFLLSFLVLMFSRNGGFELVENFIKTVLNAT